MHALVAYSRPRGKYGRYIFTIMLYFTFPTETVQIDALREKNKYSCDRCGKWISIPTYKKIPPSEKREVGTLTLYRYDNVEPGDHIDLYLKDPELVFFQWNRFYPNLGYVDTSYSCHPFRNVRGVEWDKKPIYQVILLDWDEYLMKRSRQSEPIRVEEDLVQQTMNAERITITRLLLEPEGSPLEIEEQKCFIEGELRYLS